MEKLKVTDGILIRQRMDRTSPVYTNSPDLILTGTAPAFDESAIIDVQTYSWYLSQTPVPGSPNYLYIRGVNYSDMGTQDSRVYLYWVAEEHLLNPAQWQSSGFSVNGVDQNHVEIRSDSMFDIVMTHLKWTPRATNVRYYLISWIDNSASPVPPVWPTEPFADRAALHRYVADHATMAVLDTVYQGAFLRQFPKQTVFQAGTGAKTSPDLIVTGVAAAKDAASFTSQGSYDSDTLSATAARDVRNFVYVRAINTTGGAARARVYLYWTPSSRLSPVGWRTDSFAVAGHSQNWVDLTATRAGEVMVSTVPVVWWAPASETDPPVLIAYVDNSVNPKPPDFTPFGYTTPTGVQRFMASLPRLTWLAITGTAVPKTSMSWNVELAAGTGDNNRYVGVQLSKIPTDGTVSLSVPGPDADSTIVVQSLRVPDPNAYVAWPVTYPDNFRTSAVLTYSEGATPPGGGSIVATTVPRPTRGH
jgi:hypothetical protein